MYVCSGRCDVVLVHAITVYDCMLQGNKRLCVKSGKWPTPKSIIE